MSAARPTRPEPEPEDLFNVTVTFNDGEPPIELTEVPESAVAEMCSVLGHREARIRLQPRPGFHYFTPANRIRHITATTTNEASK